MSAEAILKQTHNILSNRCNAHPLLGEKQFTFPLPFGERVRKMGAKTPMEKKRPIIFTLFISALFITGVLTMACVEGAAGIKGDKLEPKIIHVDISLKSEKASIEFISLERRNWESHGTDVTINKEGIYEVAAVYLGKKEKIREGTLTRKQMNDLAQLIEKSRYYELQNEYKGPFKTEFSWWGYQLTIKTNQWIKSIRFHSEDDTVPKKLKELVEVIMRLTK